MRLARFEFPVRLQRCGRSVVIVDASKDSPEVNFERKKRFTTKERGGIFREMMEKEQTLRRADIARMYGFSRAYVPQALKEVESAPFEMEAQVSRARSRWLNTRYVIPTTSAVTIDRQEKTT